MMKDIPKLKRVYEIRTIIILLVNIIIIIYSKKFIINVFYNKYHLINIKKISMSVLGIMV